nr:immunoglobulin light chain junction region [Macaca mulatta]MOV61812.1 immunoglobulin light chain junction region [Macaca mulatta]MOV61924.1 immunoglobulin light chain junction region [Macaca mulatta]MOV62030.1 immunoglobulin light chain junction region [Macaca mulatta]MOV62077.1 immunoglobulin light chain junction region [Macaca mulatta]
CQHGHDTPFTF